MSLDNGFAKGDSLSDEDPFEILRISHEKEILKYEKEIKNLKEFYEKKIKSLRRSITPQKGKQRNSINIMDEYICPDTVSCGSKYRPQNLRNVLREQFDQGRSAKKVDDTASFTTTNYFLYPDNSKKNLNGEDIFMRETECEELQLRFFDSDVKEEDLKNNMSTVKKYIERYLPSKQFVKGFSIGGLAGSILALAVYQGLNRN